MTAKDTWHAQMKAGREGDWDKVLGYFAADCEWTLLPPGTVFHGSAEIVKLIQSGFDAAAAREKSDVRNEFANNEWGVYEYTSRAQLTQKRLVNSRPKLALVGIAFSFVSLVAYSSATLLAKSLRYQFASSITSTQAD